MRPDLKFSVIVPTLNEEHPLPICLEAIKNQSYSSLEILVIDAHSDDRTVETAKRIGATVVSCGMRNAGAQRNLGARLAKGEVVVFIDADTIISQNLLEQFRETLSKDTRTVGVFPKLLANEGSIVDRFLFRLLRESLRLSNQLGLPLSPGACCAYRKESFYEIGGFAEGILLGEDSELSLRIQKLGKIKYTQACHAKTSLRSIRRTGRVGWIKRMVKSTFPLLMSAVLTSVSQQS